MWIFVTRSFGNPASKVYFLQYQRPALENTHFSLIFVFWGILFWEQAVSLLVAVPKITQKCFSCSTLYSVESTPAGAGTWNHHLTSLPSLSIVVINFQIIGMRKRFFPQRPLHLRVPRRGISVDGRSALPLTYPIIIVIVIATYEDHLTWSVVCHQV